MYFRVNLKMKKPTLYCSFAWIGFIKLNLKVAFLLLRRSGDGRFLGQVKGWGILRNRGILVMGDDFEIVGGGDG